MGALDKQKLGEVLNESRQENGLFRKIVDSVRRGVVVPAMLVISSCLPVSHGNSLNQDQDSVMNSDAGVEVNDSNKVIYNSVIAKRKDGLIYYHGEGVVEDDVVLDSEILLKFVDEDGNETVIYSDVLNGHGKFSVFFDDLVGKLGTKNGLIKPYVIDASGNEVMVEGASSVVVYGEEVVEMMNNSQLPGVE